MSFIERNVFAPKSEKPKKPEVEMVGAILGEEGRREFEKKWGKKNAPTVEEPENLVKGLTKKEVESMDHFKLKRAEDLLGRENVHGKRDVEFLLGFKLNPKDISPLLYSEADFLKSKEIKEKTGVEEMLVLFTKDRDGSLLTGEKLHSLIQKKYDEMGLYKFLLNNHRYKNEEFYKTLGLQHEWKLITKRCIPNSKNKRHHFEKGDKFKHEDTQEYAIEQYAEMVGVPRAKLHRPEPFQMLDAVALHLTATERDEGKGRGERLLQDEFHWSDTRFSNGECVYVGGADAAGAFVKECARDTWNDRLAICLSRDPS